MNQPEQDDIELEISDLPGTNNSRRVPAFLHTLTSRPTLYRRLWRVVTAGGILVLLFFTLYGNLPFLQSRLMGLFTHATPAPTSQFTGEAIQQNISRQLKDRNINIWRASKLPVLPPSATLDTAPQSCLMYTLTQNFDFPSFPAGVGGDPIWVTGFDGPRAMLNHLVRATPTQYGWYQQLLLVGQTNFNGTITLLGGMVSRPYALWFGSYSHDGQLMKTFQINPIDTSVSNHTTDDQQWGMFPISVYIARAGCYYLEAIWPGGGWTVYFAAGR